MIGLILLIGSWILLRLEGKGLGELGFNQPTLRLKEFALAFLATGIVAALQQWGFSQATGVPWISNPNATLQSVLGNARWTANSVLYEEFLFRGYLLYQALRFMGTRRGVLVGAAAFGVYHWFSYGALGNPVMMAFIFFFTGAFGFMCAVAFERTKSLAAPIGLHLGWNFVSYVIFSAGPIGGSLFIPGNGESRIKATGPAQLLIGTVLPLAMITAVVYFLAKRKKPLLPGSVVNPVLAS